MAAEGTPLPRKLEGPLAPPPDYWKSALAAQSGTPESAESIAARLGLTSVRSFIIAQPGELAIGKKDIVFEILDGDERLLFELVRDLKNAEEVTKAVSPRVRQTVKTSRGDIVFVMRASVLKAVDPQKNVVARLGFLYLADVAKAFYVPTGWDCLYFEDTSGLVLFQNPARLTPEGPDKVTLSESFAPSGELVLRRVIDPATHLWTFYGRAGDVVATASRLGRHKFRRLNELQTLEMKSPTNPLFPLVSAIMVFVYGPMLRLSKQVHQGGLQPVGQGRTPS